jgi:hypothetical protein
MIDYIEKQEWMLLENDDEAHDRIILRAIHTDTLNDKIDLRDFDKGLNSIIPIGYEIFYSYNTFGNIVLKIRHNFKEVTC